VLPRLGLAGFGFGFAVGSAAMTNQADYSQLGRVTVLPITIKY
jgi:hypothetical protein